MIHGLKSSGFPPALRAWAWLGCFCLATATGSAAELLKNNDFSKGLEGWTFSQQEGKADAVVVPEGPNNTPSVKVTVAKTAEKPGRISLRQSPFPVRGKQAYILSLSAKANGQNPVMTVSVTQSRSPNEELGLAKSEKLTAEWKQYEFPFVCKKDEERALLVLLNVGLQTGDFWIANVSLREKGAENAGNDKHEGNPSPAPKTEAETAGFEDLIKNVDFSKGMEGGLSIAAAAPREIHPL